MDETNVCLAESQMTSINSKITGADENECSPRLATVRTRICLIGELGEDSKILEAAQAFGVPVVSCTNGSGFINDGSWDTVFVLDEFSGPIYDAIHRSEQRILGPAALQQYAEKGEGLPSNGRPLYNTAMSGLVLCFTGFRKKDELNRLITLIHNMGGSIRKDMVAKVTHLIANGCGGEKYQYAVTFRLPVMSEAWVYSLWEKRNEVPLSATSEEMMSYKLKPFHGARVCFFGFPDEERQHMTEVVDSGETYSLLKCNIVVPRPECLSPIPPVSPTQSSMAQACMKMEISSSSYTLRTNTGTIEDVNLEESAAHHSTPVKNVNENFVDTLTPISETCSEESLSSLMPCSKIPKLDPLSETSEADFFNSSEYSINPLMIRSSLPANFATTHRMEVEAELCSAQGQGTDEPSIGSQDVPVDSIIPPPPTATTPGKKCNKNPFKTPLTRRLSFAFSRSSFSRKSDASAKIHASNRVVSMSCDERPPSPQPPPSSVLPKSCGTQPATTEEQPVTTPVVDESMVQSIPEKAPLQAPIVKAEWFWVSVQNEGCADEKDYLFEDYLESMLSPSGRRGSNTPGVSTNSTRARKRKRFRDAMSKLVHNESPALHKRRSSVSDAGLLSISGSFLDSTNCTPEKTADVEVEAVESPRKIQSARHQVFMELMFKSPLENMSEAEGPLLNNTELKIIFGNLPPIYEVHKKMLEELSWAANHWKEDFSIGKVFLKYAPDLIKAYPPFVNFFENSKEMLLSCDQSKPRFHAFLKICQTRPECGRQSLQELLIRPVQRLPSISLLLNEILKHTNKSNQDYTALEQALSSIREVMTHINEDKRKTEGQLPHLVSSHRNFIVRCDVIELSDGLSGRGDNLVCKKRSKAFNSLKSPNTTSSLHSAKLSNGKPYKHIRLMPLSNIKRVIDIRETDDCHNVFALTCRSHQEVKEKLYSFTLADEETDKLGFLRTLCRQMANTACTTGATQDFNKTPSKLKRAVSTMMSPFGSTTNLTPASQLAQMRLASCNNLNDTNCIVHSYEMEGKQKRTSYDATFKRKVILYAEKNGNRMAGREFNVAESNVRLWRQQKLALFATKASRKKFTGPRKGRHPNIEEKVLEFVRYNH
ncbi:hypothetical protein C0J52_11128 [Blattella germanica]|nr:hypothetical protein C0J52_11128 [Blattella germanica]